jgi:predicted DCC family thiol-disulfide oxidoreductase YuxK
MLQSLPFAEAIVERDLTMPQDAITRMFYDGQCGLCHRTVRFLAARDRDGRLYRFAPRDGQAYVRQFDAATRQAMPGSVVVLTGDGRVLTRSAAVLHLLEQLGGGWRWLARLAALVPHAWRDWVYDRIAAVRRRLLATPPTACPMVPQAWRGRFED